MSKMFSLLCVLLFASQTLGFSFWNDLRVKWDYRPVGDAYETLPRNTIDAVAQGWVKIGGEDCHNDGAFNGFRYVHPRDGGVAILFDVNGFAGGVQSILPHDELILEEGTTEWGFIPMYQNSTIDGVDYFTVTVYFTRPEVLCEVSNSDDGHIGTSSQVYFQNGHGIENLKVAYKFRSDAIANGWNKNQCVPGMGWHNFYQVDKYEEHDCNRIQPTCILYNEFGEMFGFCLAFPGNASSTRYEHPNSQAVRVVFGDPPQCLLDLTDRIGLTTAHFYFNNVPWKVGC